MAIVVATLDALRSAASAGGRSFGLSLPMALLLLTLLFWHWHRGRRAQRHTFPPGPTPLPLIGNLAQIDLANPHRSFVAWKRRYGPVYTVWLPKPHVVIAGTKELDEYFVSPANAEIFADRPTHSFLYGIFNKHQPDGDGIILARRAVAQKHRRFALGAFRQLGIHGPRGESLVRLHVDELVQRLAEKALHDPLLDDLHSQFAFCIGNIINHFVFGRNYKYNDQEFLRSKRLIERATKEVSNPQLLLVDTYPSLRFLLPAYWRYCRVGFELQRQFLREIDAHIDQMRQRLMDQQQQQQTAETGKGQHNEKVPQAKGSPMAQRSAEEVPLLEQQDNFIAAFLLGTQQNDWDDPAFKLSLALCAGDLWAGGLETLVATLNWAVLYMLNYPDVQQRLHAELSDRLGGRPFRLSDRIELPYLRAFIDELQRIINVLPWNLPHSVGQEVLLCGRWRIPANTQVMAQLGAVHLDPDLFPAPEQFRPDRFLDAQGNYCPPAWLRPFGVGKRMCLGESLAKMELFTILAALVQNFEFSALFPDEVPTLRRNNGLANLPDPFKCVIRLRPTEPILG
ncbi:hypothetical protein niasHT_037843 [Heterodera trifolii]|uniref:Cytochrome P450 n=1 Tax=Heterodera trifolii TaxID=157864 RepID=A0ABD2IWL4_9BILA